MLLAFTANYDIKIQVFVDAWSFFKFNLKVYAGKQLTGSYAISNKAFEVYISVQPQFDNWFTSHELMVHLLTNHRFTSLGTVEKNKKMLLQCPTIRKKNKWL